MRVACLTLLVLGLGVTACGTKKELAPQSAAYEAAQSLERRAQTAYSKGDWRGAQESLNTAAYVYQSLALNDAYAQTQLSLARIELETHSRDGVRLAAVRAQLQALLRMPNVSVANQRLAQARLAASWLKTSDWAAAKPYLDMASASCAQTCPEQHALQAMQAQWLSGTGQDAEALKLTHQLVEKTHIPEASKSGISQAKTELANALRLRAQFNLRLGNARAAAQDAQAALALDQTLGVSARVIADLELLLAAQEALSKTHDGAKVSDGFQTNEVTQTRTQLMSAQAALAALTRE